MNHLLTGLAAVGLPTPCAERLGSRRALGTVLNWVFWIALFACLMSLIMVGAQVALAHRRGEGIEHATGIAKVIGGIIIITGASGFVNLLLNGHC